MSKVKISVIVPIYNVEKYLDECLKSIKEQTFSDFEVIMVDDGSTDKSVEIATKYTNLDDRFNLFFKKNGGAADARNYGIEKSNGEYVAFIDSDDSIRKEFLEKLYSAIVEHNADVAVCDFRFYFINTGKTKRAHILSIGNNRVYNREQALKVLLRDYKFRFYLWNKLWKISLFKDNKIKIPNMMYEDAVASSMVFCHITKAVSLDYSGYIHKRAFSKHKEPQMTKDRVNDYINTIPGIRKYLEEQGVYKNVKYSFYHHRMHVIFSIPSLVYQVRNELDNGVINNCVSGIKKVFKCSKASPDKLESLKNTNTKK